MAASAVRLRFLSCLRLAHAGIFQDGLHIGPLLARSEHSAARTLARLRGDIILKCVKGLPQSRVEDLLSPAAVNFNDPDWKQFVEIDESMYLDPHRNISLTTEHKQLYREILKVSDIQESAKTDDGFASGPVFESDFDPSYDSLAQVERSSLVQALSVLALMLVGCLLYKRFSQCPESKPEAAKHDRKKRR